MDGAHRETSAGHGLSPGEIVQSAKDKKNWGAIGWHALGGCGLGQQRSETSREKNDHTKSVTQPLGRSVPLTSKCKTSCGPLYDASPTKSGLIFTNTINSVTGAFTIACDKAKPPITDLTFHSLRKIATKALSKKVNNPMELSRLTATRAWTC